MLSGTPNILPLVVGIGYTVYITTYGTYQMKTQDGVTLLSSLSRSDIRVCPIRSDTIKAYREPSA